jgi:3D (Asp-Asp-Asp) domain-containing protein
MIKSFSMKPLLSMALGMLVAGFADSAFAASSYTVKKDDTFFKISQRYNIALDKVLAANPGVDPFNLQIGQTIQLPTAAATASVTAVTAKSAAAPKANVVKTASGQELTFSRKINAVATAYTASAEENGGWAGLDYMGNKLNLGTIAVDPSVIPLGSTVYIKGYKHNGLPAQGMIAKATDIGGAIKGARVDIFIPTNARSFGKQNVELYVLK